MAELPFVMIASAVAIVVTLTALWLVSVVVKDASIIDIFWGPGFVLVAWVAYLFSDGVEARKLLLATLATVWGLRLGIYLAWRNLGHGEDPRYQAMRERAEQAGKNFALTSYARVYLLQGTVMWIVSLPLQLGQTYNTPEVLGPLAWLGSAVFAIGFLFEAFGDYQLAAFKADPAHKGLVMDRGLWRYTRHPNYFGNACLWWGIFLVSVENSVGWWGLISPVFMTFLLLKVSGVSLLEKSLSETKPAYRDYVERTSAFFPLPPKAARDRG
ncbi:MAG: DUF1295 domain-containing protein [Pseudomonadota bacterium]